MCSTSCCKFWWWARNWCSRSYSGLQEFRSSSCDCGNVCLQHIQIWRGALLRRRGDAEPPWGDAKYRSRVPQPHWTRLVFPYLQRYELRHCSSSAQNSGWLTQNDARSDAALLTFGRKRYDPVLSASRSERFKRELNRDRVVNSVRGEFTRATLFCQMGKTSVLPSNAYSWVVNCSVSMRLIGSYRSLPQPDKLGERPPLCWG